MNERSVVYITYDGLNEQLGQSQVLPYVHGLAERGHRIEILSFEKPGSPLCYRKTIAPGVRWTALRYHKTPTVPATLLDLAQGGATLAIESILDGADLVHVRSYVACAMALPWVEARRLPLLFDMRGLWADERVDAGTWPDGGRLYRTTKRVERVLLSRADAITTLTVRLQRYLRDEYPFARDIDASIHVIPTCVDLAHFRPDVAPDPGLSRELTGHRVLLYLGAIGSYYLPAEMARFYLAWRKYASPSRFLVVSRQDAREIREVLAQAGVADELVVRAATRNQVPAYVRCAEASFGLFGSRELAAHGCAPTKTGETLACGLPFASSVVGDVPWQLRDSPAGVAVQNTVPATLDQAARELARKAAAPGVAVAARALAERWYSLSDALDAYDGVYRTMPRGHRRPGTAADTAWPPVVR